MVKNGRKNLLAGVGLLAAGVAAGAIGMMGLRGGDGPYSSSPPTRTMGAAPATSTAFITAVAGNCELSPILPSAGDGDGRESLQARPGTGTADEVASLILSGKEAAAAGRQRDAEIDFLNACRNAAALPDADPIPLADAMYQLARHYANVGAFGAPKAGDLYQRSERLYSASLEAFRARYGAEHEKTRFAQEGLTTVQHATGGKAPAAIAKAPPAPVPAPAPVVAAPEPAPVAAAPEPAPAPVAAAPAPAPQAVAQAPESKPAATKVAETPPAPKIAETPPAPVAPKVAEPKPAEPKVAAPRPVPPRPEETRAAEAQEAPAASRAPRTTTVRRNEPVIEPAAEAPAARPRTEARRSAPVVDTNPSELAAEAPAPVRRQAAVTVAEPDAPAASGSTGMGAPGSGFGGADTPTAEGSVR